MILEDDPITDNLQKLLEHYQKLEKEAIKSGKYHFVNLKPHKQ